MEGEKLDREACVELLQRQALRLRAAGDDRFPRKADFTPDEVMRIKAQLGPWTRALEAAGVKPPVEGREERRLERRIRQKRNRTRFKIEKQAGADKER